ncbi:SirB family protein [Agaribacter marinus]|uniref:SirB family protein n=2 Tax=Agaribacter marinus TaxID=1431249 RepID=A0AA37SY33_9ALTE|nr:SirB family protein [Agaribacter marinus]
MYMMLKHLHQTSMVLSLVIFFVAFAAIMFKLPFAQKKWLKILPHILYTIAIITAVTMIVQVGAYDHKWLASKALGFVLYVLSVSFALKWARNNMMRVVGLISAIVWLAVTASVAISKNSLF